MDRLFLDTGYLLALEIADDEHHSAATEHWARLRHQAPLFVTTSYVFDEVVTFFNSRDLHGKAVEVGERLLQSPKVDLIQVDQELFVRGWELLKKHDDKRYSLTDCISFVVMQNRALMQALTFDRHFQQAGFVPLP